MRIRYSRWSGATEPFPADIRPADVLDAVSDDLLAGEDPNGALGNLLRRGMGTPGGPVRGLDELRRMLEAARRRELSAQGLEGPLADLAAQLDDLVAREHAAVDALDDPLEAATLAGELDALPAGPAERLAALQRYDFTDGQVAREFRELVERLRHDVAQAAFGRLAGALGSLSDDDVARMRDLLAELNAMIDRQERGEDPRFAQFMDRFGDLVPGDPADLDELLEELARRMSAMSRMMAGLTPEQHAQLAELAEQVLGDLDLAFQTDQLQRALQRRHPELGWDRPPTGVGDGDGLGDGSMSRAVDAVEHLAAYDDLAAALERAAQGGPLGQVDADEVRRLLGSGAVADLEGLQAIERALEEAGALHRDHGRRELTPGGVRQLGERALTRIFSRALASGAGEHRATAAGGDGELTGATRQLAFGDPFRLDVSRTVRNAVLRHAGDSPSSGPVEVRAEDFELAEAERRVRASTVLLLDMSFSMPLRGNWEHAKRLALALEALVASKFPQDRFAIVGFSDYARRLQSRDLLVSGWERVHGTNMEHAFRLARRILAADRAADPHVIMVTDGEPTAHLEGDQAWFTWPPEPRTLARTMAEAARLGRAGAALDVFLLDHEPGVAGFVEQMVATVGGRIFHPASDDLGRMVIQDFLAGRRAVS